MKRYPYPVYSGSSTSGPSSDPLVPIRRQSKTRVAIKYTGNQLSEGEDEMELEGELEETPERRIRKETVFKDSSNDAATEGSVRPFRDQEIDAMETSYPDSGG